MGDEVSSNIYSTTWKATITLSVVSIEILCKGRTFVSLYALLDTGSEGTFFFKSIAEKLRIQISNCHTLAVCTLSGEPKKELVKSALPCELLVTVRVALRQ